MVVWNASFVAELGAFDGLDCAAAAAVAGEAGGVDKLSEPVAADTPGQAWSSTNVESSLASTDGTTALDQAMKWYWSPSDWGRKPDTCHLADSGKRMGPCWTAWQ